MLNELPLEVIINDILPSLDDISKINLLSVLVSARNTFNNKSKKEFTIWINSIINTHKHIPDYKYYIVNALTLNEYNKIISPKLLPEIQHFLIGKKPYSYVLSLCRVPAHKNLITIKDWALQIDAYYIQLYFVRQSGDLYNTCFGITSLCGTTALFHPNIQGIYSSTNLLFITINYFIKRLYTFLKTNDLSFIVDNNVNMGAISNYNRQWIDCTWEFIQQKLGSTSDPKSFEITPLINTTFHPQVHNLQKMLARMKADDYYFDNDN